MTLAVPTNNDTARPVPRLEEQFQPILPKVDHILSLLRDHQVQLASQPPSSSTHGNKRAEGQADLEDMIIKEASSIRNLLNSQKAAAYSLPGGHLGLDQVQQGIKRMDAKIQQTNDVLERFEQRIDDASIATRLSTS